MMTSAKRPAQHSQREDGYFEPAESVSMPPSSGTLGGVDHYASAELRRRHERTLLMIKKAQEQLS